MTYDFDTLIDRRGTDCVKWDTAKEDDVLPMWVADMDFKAAPCIAEALRKRMEHGVFGYTMYPKATTTPSQDGSTDATIGTSTAAG